MECPSDKKYSPILKMCISKGAFSLEKGKSKSGCPQGRHWNAYTRKCIGRSLYKKLYGTPRKQNTIKSVKNNRKPKSISPAIKRRPNILPSGRKSTELNVGKPNKNSFMNQGLSRKEMLQWVNKTCKNQENPISLEPYIEVDDNELESLIKLGSDFCYPFEALDQHMKSSIDRGIPVKDIMNPSYRLDSADYGAIQHVGRRLKKTYKLPKIGITKPMAKYKLFIDKGDSSDFKFVFLFDETKVKTKADGKKEYIQAIPDGGWLGYIPASGTEELEKLIKEAFKKGRLFTTSKPPFDCCKFHIKKTKDYWKDNTVAKIKSLESEIRNYL
jgi:hypothetical protein